jgi:2-polyprenyl-6-hydroxyphenyl methylase/3-demethylubiquinone-9 3-methyltransferase
MGQTSTINGSNVDTQELEKFADLAHRWWDPSSEFKPLHDINPLRLNWITSCVDLRNQRVLDVGCGGGLLSEAMALQGAQVMGIDLGEKALGVARLHLLESQLTVDYRKIAVEALAQEFTATFDVITCMELIEHVPDPGSVVAACASLVKPGGQVFFSTINRNPKSYLLAVIAAEYLLRMLPRGTHDYARFVRPAELAQAARAAGLDVEDIVGLHYNPWTRRYGLGRNTDVNYLLRARRPW